MSARAERFVGSPVQLGDLALGSQQHDNNGGILASGLFWTLPVLARRDRPRASGGYAQIGRERNGVFL